MLSPIFSRKSDPEFKPILEGQTILQHPIPKEQGEQGQIKNISQSQEQSIEQNESTILTQEDQENIQQDQQNTTQNQENALLFEQPEILLPQECFVERCDQIITGRQLR